jgi:hypothetical protein
VAISPDGKLVLVTTRGDSAVLVFALDGKRLTQTGRIALPDTSVPGGVAIAPDGKRALVTRDGDSTVTVLAIQGGQVTLAGRDFYTGLRPYGVQISPSGDWAVVGNVGRGNGDVGMQEIRCRNDHRVDVVPRYDLLPMGGHHRGPGLLPGGLEGCGIGITQGMHADVGTKCESGQMILQRDAAGADQGEVQGAHGENGTKRPTRFRRSGARG